MHAKTYPDFLTPRDEKPSPSSSEEKFSEFGQQENENEREGKTEQGSVYSIYLYLYIYLDYMIDYYSKRAYFR